MMYIIGQISYVVVLIIGVPALTFFYYQYEFVADIDKVFLSISTFLFSIFTGFFISTQAKRYNAVRETVTAFDGKMSNMYRCSGHISADLQKSLGKIIKAHYKKILDTGKWHIHFTEKSNTIKNIHAALDEHVTDDIVTKVGNQSLGAILKGIDYCQAMRKKMLAHYSEKIPREQWVLVFFFACILVATVSVFPAKGFLFGAILKAAFVASVFSVLLTLYKLDNLIFTESIMGEHSAHDVLGIIENKR